MSYRQFSRYARLVAWFVAVGVFCYFLGYQMRKWHERQERDGTIEFGVPTRQNAP